MCRKTYVFITSQVTSNFLKYNKAIRHQHITIRRRRLFKLIFSFVFSGTEKAKKKKWSKIYDIFTYHLNELVLI